MENNKLIVNCLHCGTPFEQSRKDKVYCCHKCGVDAKDKKRHNLGLRRTPKTEKKCGFLYCEEKFLSGKGKKFCCYQHSRLESRRLTGAWVPSGEIIKCSHCDCDFEKNKETQIYCSKRCRDNAASARHNLKPERRAYATEYYLKVAKFKKFPYKKHKNNCCDFCGFEAVHTCQLDVDHIDGNHKNDNPSNLQTLCANCHRLKTQIKQDWDRRLKIAN